MALPSQLFLTIATQQLSVLMAFYQGLLQCPPQQYQPEIYAEFELHGVRLGIFQTRPEAWSEFDAPTSGALSLCLAVDDLDGAIAHLTQLGYPPPGPVRRASHGREIYSYDPDGNRLILYEAQQ
jgi:predicted enzyme related to lactoylglutathione lyase